MFFQLQILGHEMYHFYRNTPYSTAICFDRDFNTDIIAFTISDAGDNYRILAKDGNSASSAKTFLFYDMNEETTADMVGYLVALFGCFVLLSLFYLAIRNKEPRLI